MDSNARPTHAGGVVFRVGKSGDPEYLLVTARRSPHDWVHPKGHIERGETPEECAVREVEEEAGVDAVVVHTLPDVPRDVPGDRQLVRYYVMKTDDESHPGEGRQSRWLSFAAARDLLTVPALRAVLEQADAFLRKR